MLSKLKKNRILLSLCLASCFTLAASTAGAIEQIASQDGQIILDFYNMGDTPEPTFPASTFTLNNWQKQHLLYAVNYWEQVLFSWIVGNADMHLKNYSLYSKDDCHYTLAPAYDLLSTALVMPEDKEELALTLCGKKRKISKSNFLEAMKQSGLNDKVCHNIFISFGKVKRKWVELIHKSFLPEDMQNEYMELIESRISVLED